jgi:ATP-independent RNA helicase DbpA
MSMSPEPAPSAAFSALGVTEALSRAIGALGFDQPTPVQTACIPPVLRGRDVRAQAQTGSGKTLAMAVGLLTQLDASRAAVQSLVLCPTRELADQVAGEVRRVARFMPNVKVAVLCGGTPVRAQAVALTPRPHVVVGTPGRLLDHLRRETLTLDGVRVLALDEADRMLDMGFGEAIREVVGALPKKRQTLLFSATFPSTIEALSAGLQRAPEVVEVASSESELPDIDEAFLVVEAEARADVVRGLLLAHLPESALVFCGTREETRAMAQGLVSKGFSALALHGELEQRERDEVMAQFSNGSARVLVATDVAARGLDIKGLACVIACELPKDLDTYVHRIGRTGRAGARGAAFALVTPRQVERAQALMTSRGGGPRWLKPSPPPPGARPTPPAMATLALEGGRQDKLRPGDILGALCGDVGLAGTEVGAIQVGQTRSYIAIARARVGDALRGLRACKVKGRAFRVRSLP